jgi:glycosyltransferase involved in cell wall biosynthesis
MKESCSFGRASVNYIKAHHNEIDFVYNDGWQLFGLYMVAKVCVKYNIPYIVPIQDIYPESLLTKLPNALGLHRIVKLLLGWMDKYYIRHAAAVRTISDSMADYLSKTRGVSRDRFIVIANWQNDEEFADWQSTCRNNGKTVFMFVGNNNKQANVDLMIRAFHKADIQNAIKNKKVIIIIAIKISIYK